jgi:hypothetical protein
MTDTKTGKPFTWRFFGIVIKPHRYWVKVIRIGAKEEPGRDISIIQVTNDPKNDVYFLPPDRWPDGVCVYRMKAVLEGRIEV